MAPTYTIAKEKAMNSTSRQSSKAEDNKKTDIRDSIEWTGFRELTTKKEKKSINSRTEYINKIILNQSLF